MCFTDAGGLAGLGQMVPVRGHLPGAHMGLQHISVQTGDFRMPSILQHWSTNILVHHVGGEYAKHVFYKSKSGVGFGLSASG